MGKLKNLEKKPKGATVFDKKTPGNRVKSLSDEKAVKKSAGISKPTKKDITKTNKRKKAKILTQLKQEVEATAKKIESTGIKEESNKLVPREIVKKALIALKDGIKKECEMNAAKNLFDDELRIGLRVVSVKIPDCPPHVKKIVLEHSLFEDHPDICFFIRDSQVKKADQEPTVREFEKKLDAVGVKCKKIMTLTQLKQDFSTYNLKIKLCNLYDIFLVESSIAEHVYKILGKVFISKRKRPQQILIQKENILKDMIDKAILKSTFKVHPNSNLSSFDVGTVKMDNVKIADNIMTAIEQLKAKWPGGWRNINRIFLTPMRPSKVSIPIFYSSINPNDVPVPVIKGDKVGRLEKLAAELKTKAKKLKLDLKKKKIVKNKEVNIDKTIKTAVKELKETSTTKSSKKKEKKTSESKDVVPSEDTASKSSKKKDKKSKKDTEAEEVVQSEEAVVKKSKKNKKKAQEEKVIQEQSTEEPAAKKKKKKSVKLESNDASTAATISESVDEQPKSELEKQQKKNKDKKNKSKAVLTDTNKTALVSEKEQSPKKKKNKNKKK